MDAEEKQPGTPRSIDDMLDGDPPHRIAEVARLCQALREGRDALNVLVATYGDQVFNASAFETAESTLENWRRTPARPAP